jgi:uncharacterized protein YndB with AHSA1/START domain
VAAAETLLYPRPVIAVERPISEARAVDKLAGARGYHTLKRRKWMSRTTVVRTIDAPVERVFDTVAHVESFAKAVPHIVGTEFLSDVESGVGTRFRETRRMRGKETTTELEVTEYVENDRVRILADAGGTVWDTVFEVAAESDQVRLKVTMDAKAYQLMSKLVNPFIKGFVKRAIESDMDAVKIYCEEAA